MESHNKSNNNNNNNNNNDNNNNIINFGHNDITDSFKFTIKITGEAAADGTEIEIVSLKYLSNF